jgi:YidC/Oxa1 family membrane protein insertase
MSLLDPLSHALATVVAVAHAGLTAAGLDSSSGAAWVLSIAAVVVAVRLALLPLAVHGARQARAAARARPQLRALAERYRDRRDPASLRAYAEERRAVAAEHRLSPWGCLPLVAQLPVWFALYHLLTDVAAGTPVGPLDGTLVASLGAATVLGVPLAQRGYLGAGVAHLAVVAGLALAAAALSFLTQRLALAAADVPEAVARVQQLLPALSVVGLLVAGGFVPLALLVYWVLNTGWTLGQSIALRRLVADAAG